MSAESSFPQLMHRLREGDAHAATTIFFEYSRRLSGLARQRLPAQLAGKVDADDILQSVFRSFFRRQAEGEFELNSWDNVWSLLTLITLRKCGRQIDHFHAARRNVHREARQPREDESVTSFEAIAREPSPEEAAMLTETVRDLLSDLGPRDRAIVERTLQGESPAVISHDLGCSERTVERIRARVRQRLESMCAPVH